MDYGSGTQKPTQNCSHQVSIFILSKINKCVIIAEYLSFPEYFRMLSKNISYFPAIHKSCHVLENVWFVWCFFVMLCKNYNTCKDFRISRRSSVWRDTTKSIWCTNRLHKFLSTSTFSRYPIFLIVSQLRGFSVKWKALKYRPNMFFDFRWWYRSKTGMCPFLSIFLLWLWLTLLHCWLVSSLSSLYK